MGSYDSGAYGIGYIDSSDSKAKHLKGFRNHFYQSSYPANAAMWQQGSIDTRFKVGDQSLYSMVYGSNQYFQSRRFFFNLIRRHLNMICGYQRKNRKSTVTLPNFQDDALSDDYNGVIKWCENRDGFQEYLSQAFENSCTTGISLLHLYPDYTFDPISGDLFTDQVAYCNFLIDPFFRKQDLSDCNGIWRRRWVTKEVAKTLLPGREKDIDKLKPSGAKDGRFPLQAELINLNYSQLMPYDEFHYLDSREATIILDPFTGEAMEWEQQEDDPEDLLDQVLRQQPWLVLQKKQIPTVKLNISIGDIDFYDGPNQLKIDRYPFVPTLCYHEPDIQTYAWKVQGIVRNLRDAQYLYNMRKVIEMDLLQSQVQNAWIYPIDVVVDPKAFRQTENGTVIPLKAGHRPEEIQRLDPQGIPQSVLELSRSLADDITKISGVNEELLGAATDDKAGILAMLRQGAGLVTLQTVFDKLDYSQRLYGEIRLEAIRKNFSKGKIRSILNRDPHPKFFLTHSQKYSITVEEGNYSATQRQTELQQLLYFKELGMPIANKSILNAAIITNKKQVIADMNQEVDAQQQAQQQQAQQQAKIDNAKTFSTFAKAQSDLASAKEKTAKVNEIEAKAEHSKAQADLELVKLMIELEDMDLANIRSSFEMAEAIKLANSAANQQAQTLGGENEKRRNEITNYA